MNGKKIALFAVIVAGLLYYISEFELKKDNEKAAREAPFASLNLEALEKITVKNDAESFTLINSAPKALADTDSSKVTLSESDIEKWRLESVPSAPLDLATVNGLLSALKNLKVEEIPADQVQSDRAAYGLASPAVSIELEVAKEKRVVLLGDFNDVISQRYVALDSSPTVYLSAQDLYTAGYKRGADFRSRSPFKFADSEVLSFEQTSGESTIKFGAAEPLAWKIEKPGAFSANSIAIGNVLREVRNLRATDFLDGADAKSAEFGLDRPKLTFRMEFQSTSQRAPIDAALGVVTAPDGKQVASYLAIAGNSTVFKINGDPSAKIARPLNDLRQKRPLSLSSDEIHSLSVEAQGEPPYQLTREGDNWKIGDKVGDKPFIEQLLRDLADLEAVDFPPGKAEGIDLGFASPTAKIVITVKGEGTPAEQKKHTIVVGAKAPPADKEERFYAGIDAAAEPFIITAAILKKIAPRYEALLASETTPAPTGTPADEPARYESAHDHAGHEHAGHDHH